MSDAATVAWKAAVEAVGGVGSVSAAREAVVDALIVGLKADGIWTKLDRLWLFKTENTQSALIDLKSLVVATPVGSPTFTPNDGYTFNSTTNYIDTGTNPATAGGVYTLDSAHISIWSKTAAPTWGLLGSYDGNFTAIEYGSGLFSISINDIAASALGAYAAGLSVVTRTASNARATYSNGSLAGSSSAASTAIPNLNLFVGGINSSGTLVHGSTIATAAVSIGSGLSAGDNTAFYARLNAYMTATLTSSQNASAGFVAAGQLTAGATVLHTALSVNASARLVGAGQLTAWATVSGSGGVPVQPSGTVLPYPISVHPTRAADTSVMTGLGSISVSGVASAANLRAFNDVMQIGDTIYLGIAHRARHEWEEGVYTYVDTNRFARTIILQSSSNGAPVNFTEGIKDVWATTPSCTIQRVDENMVHTGFAEIDFGTGSSESSVEVFAAIAADSFLSAQLAAIETDDHSIEDHWTDAPIVIAGNIVVGSGFTIFAKASGADLTGKYSVSWMWK